MALSVTKMASWEFTVQLFVDEYKVPILPPEFAALLATTFELSCSTLLVLGLATRVATLPLLGMIAVGLTACSGDSWRDSVQNNPDDALMPYVRRHRWRSSRCKRSSKTPF